MPELGWTRFLTLTSLTLAVSLPSCDRTVPHSSQPQSTGAFTAPHGHTIPARNFQGRLHLNPLPGQSHIKAIVDTYEVLAIPGMEIENLPSITVEFVQDGADLIPIQRGAQANAHPYWEWIFEPGTAWDDADKAGWTRVSLPFSLQERNQNCTHYGLMRFGFKEDGAISPVEYQVGSETCKYLKVDMWGILQAEYQPIKITGSAETIASHRNLLASRLPVKRFSALAGEHPEARPEPFQPPGLEDVTVYGLVLDGVHYRGGCNTRFGPHPFCDWLDLPSYSTAKSVFAGLAFIYLEQNYPGFAETEVPGLIPECDLPDKRWEGVTMRHLLNMTSGNYDDTGYEVDEGAANVDEFFLPETHAEKLAFSCTAYSRKSNPGEIFVYHTFDTYLLGTAMNAFIREQTGPDADIFRDVLLGELLGPLGLSPVAQTSRRTYDDKAQPFTGYGLTWNPDDIARIGAWLNQQPGKQSLSGSKDFQDAMFRHREDVKRWKQARGEAYSNGFWGFNIAARINCEMETWIPFMSGYGGNVVALIPNGSVYYYFSDGDRFSWAAAAAETHKIQNFCEVK